MPCPRSIFSGSYEPARLLGLSLKRRTYLLRSCTPGRVRRQAFRELDFEAGFSGPVHIPLRSTWVNAARVVSAWWGRFFDGAGVVGSACPSTGSGFNTHHHIHCSSYYRKSIQLQDDQRLRIDDKSSLMCVPDCRTTTNNEYRMLKLENSWQTPAIPCVNRGPAARKCMKRLDIHGLVCYYANIKTPRPRCLLPRSTQPSDVTNEGPPRGLIGGALLSMGDTHRRAKTGIQGRTTDHGM